MLKKYLKTLIITSLIMLLPMAFGHLLWDELPERIAIHWGINNQPDGWAGKAVVVYGFPIFMIVMQWLLPLLTELDLKKKNHSEKLMALVLWIIPLMSLLLFIITYSNALGIEVNVGFWVLFTLGIIFMFTGNYLPKCRQNWTMGIRTRWTLTDTENWNRTHRLAGPVWMIGGLLMTICSFFSGQKVVVYGLVVIILAMCLIPTVYSYMYYKKHNVD